MQLWGTREVGHVSVSISCLFGIFLTCLVSNIYLYLVSEVFGVHRLSRALIPSLR